MGLSLARMGVADTKPPPAGAELAGKSSRVCVWVTWLQALGIALTAIGLPLANGGVSEGARAWATVIVAGVFLLGVMAQAFTGTGMHAQQRAWLWPWLVLTAIVVIQVLPLPGAWLHYVGVYPDSILREPGLAFIRSIAPNRTASLAYWAMFTTYWVTACMVAQLPLQPLRLVVFALVLIVAFEAVYGLVAHLGRHDTVLGLWPARENHSLVLGTYYNRNHIAGLLALGWPLGVAFILYGASESSRLRAREVRYFWLTVFAAAVALALFNTQSKLGSFGGLFGLTVFWLLLRYDRQRARSSFIQRFWLWLAGGLALMSAVWFGLGPLLNRYASFLAQGDVGRLQVWQAVFDLPLKTWWLGSGAGSFEDVFRLVQPGELEFTYVHLHNDWLQFTLEFGLLGTALMLASLRRSWRQLQPARLGGLRAGACGGMAAIAVHSLGDFNLQIPGTAFAFWLLLGVLCNRHLAHHAMSGHHRRHRRRLELTH